MIGLIICTGLLASHMVILNCNLFIYSETFIDTVVTCYNRYLLVNLNAPQLCLGAARACCSQVLLLTMQMEPGVGMQPPVKADTGVNTQCLTLWNQMRPPPVSCHRHDCTA